MAKLFKSVTISDEVVYLKPVAIIDVTATAEMANEPDACPEQPQDTEQLKKEAYQEGFNQGLAQGIEQATNDMYQQTALLQELLVNLPAVISENRQQLSGEIADIVLVIIQQYFINQQTNKEAIAGQINHTITQLNSKQNIELLLHPQDLAMLKAGTLPLDLQQCKNLRIVPNEQLRLGGCQVRSEHGLFDAGIERQIDNLKQVLLQIKQGDRHD